MYYPLNLNSVNIHPLFGDYLKGAPYIFDFSSNNPKNLEYNLFDFEEFNATVFNELRYLPTNGVLAGIWKNEKPS